MAPPSLIDYFICRYATSSLIFCTKPYIDVNKGLNSEWPCLIEVLDFILLQLPPLRTLFIFLLSACAGKGSAYGSLPGIGGGDRLFFYMFLMRMWPKTIHVTKKPECAVEGKVKGEKVA